MKDAHFKLKVRSLMVVVLTFVFGLNVNAQKVSVSGTVRDNTGEPVIGASVVEKGTTNGLTTNFNGEFTLSVSSNATLVISYIGYKTQEIPIGGQRNFTVTLEEDAKVLGEVVAIGYGTVKKNDATGSVTAIKPDEMNKGVVTNAQDMISGKIAGVNVTSNDGTPGGGAKIRIRGGSSLYASNDPLIVIDGLAIDNNDLKGVSNILNTINPNDIETFTVLKDASAAAIYGNRASNGVIIITTKKGKEGSKPKITYNGTFTTGNVRNTQPVLNAAEYKELVKNTFGESSKQYKLLGRADTNWQSEIFRTALGQDHNISILGGLKNMPYRVSLGYTNQEGVVKVSNFERYTGAVSLTPSLLDNHLTLNLNLKGMLVKNHYNPDVIGVATQFDPTQPIYDFENEPYVSEYGGYWQYAKFDDSGNYLGYNNLSPGSNPVALLEQQTYVSKGKDIIGNFEADYKFHFLPELKAHLGLAMEEFHSKQDDYTTSDCVYNLGHGYTGVEKADKSTKSLNTYLQYAKEFTNQKFDIMGGYEWQHVYRKGYNYGEGLDGAVYFADGPDIYKTEYYLLSFFGRLNYSIADKYLFTATVRNDRTSRFSKENRSGVFPSAAFAWKINNENFLKNSKTITDLKLRLGYGVTGQQDIGQGDYSYMPVYQYNKQAAYYQFGNDTTRTARPNGYNPNLKWEETTTYNAGLDLGILSNRITASVDYYYRVTNDLLSQVPTTVGTNFSNAIWSNIGSLTNQGFEFSINGKPISTNDVTLDLGYNVTFNQNKITKLTVSDANSSFVEVGKISDFGTIQIHKIGFPANSFYVYQQVYDNNDKPIQNLYVDRNGDGQITTDDKYLFHKASPDVTMGFSAKLIYKAFDFGTSWRSSIGNYVYNDVAAENANLNSSKIYMNESLRNKPLSAFETNFTSTNVDYKFSDYYVQNASFVKCDNITVGYTFKNLFNSIPSGRISAAVQNPFVFTKYKGLDPEVFSGIDGNVYPRPITAVVGLTLNF